MYGMRQDYYFIFDNDTKLKKFLGMLDELTDMTWASGANPLAYTPCFAPWYIIVISPARRITFDTANTLKELRSRYELFWHDVVEGPGRVLSDFVHKRMWPDSTAYDSIEEAILDCIAYTGEMRDVFDCVGDIPAEFVIGFS